MNDAMTIALSGMLAASTSFAASASNIVNAGSEGPLPPAGPGTPVAPATGNVYQPLAVSMTTAPGGAVSAAMTPSLPGYVLAYDPSAPFANMQGMVAAPNVDQAQDAVNEVTASLAYKANIATFKTAEKMEKTLLDAMA